MRAAELGSERPLIAARARERESLFRKLLPSRQHSPCTDYVSKRKQAALSVPEKRLEKEGQESVFCKKPSSISTTTFCFWRGSIERRCVNCWSLDCGPDLCPLLLALV